MGTTDWGNQDVIRMARIRMGALPVPNLSYVTRLHSFPSSLKKYSTPLTRGTLQT